MDTELRVAWNVVEKHLEDAVFGFERFDAALVSPHYTLDTLAKGPEWRLLANLDALTIGRAAIVEPLLVPPLRAKRFLPPPRVATLVLTLLRCERVDLAREGLAHEVPAVRHAALRACVLGGGPSLDTWVTEAALKGGSPVGRATILKLAAERGVAAAAMTQALRTDEPAELSAALSGVWRELPAAHEPRIIELLRHPHPEVRDAAMVAALHHGSGHGWAACQATALDPGSPHPVAMTLLAGLGEPGQHKRLAALVSSEAHRPGVLRALGFSGNVGFVPLLLNHALSTDAPSAAVAGEALGTILGPEVDKLFGPKPDQDALTAWWQQNRQRFDLGRRYLGGLPANRAAFAQALTRFPARRRYLLSLLLSILTAATCRVTTRAFTATQRAQIFAIAARGPAEPWVRQFSPF